MLIDKGFKRQFWEFFLPKELDGANKGYAVVEFETEEAALQCKRVLDGEMVPPVSRRGPGESEPQRRCKTSLESLGKPE